MKKRVEVNRGRVTDEEVEEIRTILLRALARSRQVTACPPSNDVSSVTSESAA